jgi:hypothetical protein
MAVVCKGTIPTERPPLVDEVNYADVGSIVDVSEIHAASIFRAEGTENI